MADVSRIAFYTGSILAAVGIVFGAGLYSGLSGNALARAASGVYDDTRTLITEIPNLTRERPIHFLAPAHYPGKGVTLNKVGNKAGGDDLLLLSGFLGDNQKAQLMRRDGSVLARWDLLPLAQLPSAGQCRNVPQTDWNSAAHNVLIEPDGSVLFSYESCGMVKLDRCGKKLWATREITHHSPNRLADGRIVIGGSAYISAGAGWPFVVPYWEDVVRTYDAKGKQLSANKITDLFVRNGLLSLLTSSSEDNPKVNGEFHLNEVEELPAALASAFPMFAAGDLLLSIRNLNMILVTDAKMERIKWHRVGPWIRQHDPDWGTDGRISVFDNHPDGTADGSRHGGSRIIAVDPATGATQTLYGGRKDQHFFSNQRGLHQMLGDGAMLITEANAGRAFQVDRGGRIVWEYVNRYDAKDAAWLNGVESYPQSYFTVKDWSCK